MTALALGTAQFGQAYGVTNAAGRPTGAAIDAILARARALGVTLLDTAHLYGDSEGELGRRLGAWPQARIVTKTCAFGLPAVGVAEADALEAAFRLSLARLGRNRVHALLAHRAADLLAKGGERLFERMLELRRAGLVEKIGASVYDPDEIDALSERYEIDVVQFPANAFDQRLLAGDRLGRLRRAGVETHLRSAFLQGLLLARPDRLTPDFQRWAPALDALQGALRAAGLSPMEGALAFAIGAVQPDYVVVGVTDPAELDEVAEAFARAKDVAFDFTPFAAREPELIDPRRWPSGAKAVA